MKQTYPQIVKNLFSINRTGGMKLGLKNCEDLDRLLGYPTHSLRSIHIAGTNGKGSVSTKIAAGCQAAGNKVGLYTSPHLSCFRERIRINGEMISESDVERHMNILFAICDEYDIKATFFELTTLMAFMYFAEKNVDFAILETGLGGRLDATNIAKPILSVITSISLEHTEILGNTIEEITREKAGIIKHEVPVIIGSRVPLKIVKPIANAQNSPCIQVEGNFFDYHEENCAIAWQSLEMLKIHPDAIEEGLKALPPCRLQMFSPVDLIKAGFTKCLPQGVIMDVAHNPDGMIHLLKAIRNRYGKIPLRFVLGLSGNKDIAGCLNVIKDEASAFHLVEADNERAASKEFLAKELSSIGVEENRIFCEPTISSGVCHAINLAGENEELVVICGTFFIMSAARQALGILEPRDPIDMN